MMLVIGLLCATQFALAKRFYLMTVEPGSEFWSVYGHTALVIDDSVFGFGVFSFEQEDFYQSFVRNEMTYEVGHTDIDNEILWATEDGRTLTLLPLQFSEAAEQEIIDYLRWHFKPENQSYAYDYFLQNCATKIRDIINKATQGQFKQQFDQKPVGSYFSQTFPVKKQSLMTLALAVAYGKAAYQPRSAWELMAFPEQLRQQMLDESMAPWRGALEMVVDFPAPQGWLVFIQTHWALTLVALFLVLGLSFNHSQKLTRQTWLSVQTVVGLVLIYLWFGTAHEMAAWNLQLLIFMPWALLSLKFRVLRYLMAVAALLWFPLALWQGSWYVWPLALANFYLVYQWPKRPLL